MSVNKEILDNMYDATTKIKDILFNNRAKHQENSPEWNAITIEISYENGYRQAIRDIQKRIC